MQWCWRDVALRQHGAVAVPQLRAVGVSDEQTQGLCVHGVLRRGPVKGLYVLASVPPSWLQECWLTSLRLGPEAVAFRRTAAELWDLDGQQTGVVEFAVSPGRSGRAAPASRIRHLPAVDRTTWHGMPVTTVARTLVDLGSAQDADGLERALESALRRDLVTVDAVRSAADRAGQRQGLGLIREVLGRRPAGAAATESDLETRFLQLSRQTGIGEPVRQFQLLVSGRRLRLDFAWPDLRLAVETDGGGVHDGSALSADLRRQNRILLGGWLIIRFTWEDVVRYPEDTVGTLRQARQLATCRALGLPPPPTRS